MLVSSLSKYSLNTFVKFCVKHSQNKQNLGSLAKVIHEHYHITFSLMPKFCPFTTLLKVWHSVKYVRIWVFSDQHFPVFFRENPCTGIFYTVLGPLPQNYNFVQHLRLLKYFTRPKSTRIVVLGSFFYWSYRDQLAKKANLTKLKSMVGGTTKKMWVHFHKASHIFLISNFLS